MQTTNTIQLLKTCLAVAAICAGALAGCGDPNAFAKVGRDDAPVGSLGAELDSRLVSIVHHSTRCGEDLPAACPKELDPGVEIHIDGRSVIFDFSNVTAPGTFARADFEGYLLEVAAEANAPILFARVDTEATTLDLDDSNLAYDEAHLEVNFMDLSYDRDDFVKIDLLVGPLRLLGHHGE